MTDVAIKTSLRGMVSEAPDPGQVADLRRRAWVEQGLAIFDPKELSNDAARQIVVKEMTIRYGRRYRR